MKKTRTLDERRLHSGVGPNGRPVCRWCGTETQPPRNSYCSDRCRMELEIQAHYRVAAYLIADRDQWECQICGLDILNLAKIVGQLGPCASWPRWRVLAGGRLVQDPRRGQHHHPGLHSSWVGWLRERGFDDVTKRRMWDIDHIVPLAEGGPNDSTNLRTLCRPCHKGETRELQRKMAEQRRRKSD